MKIIVRDFFINTIASSSLIHPEIRHWLYERYGIDRNKSFISPGCFFSSNQLKLGKGSFVNYRCYFDNYDFIEIGENCLIAMDVMFITTNHEIGEPKCRAGEHIGLPIKVGNGCWICARATICPGVTIGDGCIIAAGAVVTKECFPNGLYAGVPAKRVRELPQPELSKLQVTYQQFEGRRETPSSAL